MAFPGCVAGISMIVLVSVAFQLSLRISVGRTPTEAGPWFVSSQPLAADTIWNAPLVSVLFHWYGSFILILA